MSLEQRINAAWYGRPGWLLLLLPLSYLFRCVAALRRYLISAESCGAPVIVVGNISVGGSGKTPAVLALADYCRDRGYQVGIVSRGYGGQAPHYPYLLDHKTTPSIAGDEPCLIARRSGFPVAVAPDRLAAAKLLVNEKHCNLIISDDGLQHYRLRREIEVLLIDGQRGFGNGHCLPVGPLREPVSRVNDVDLCLINGGSSTLEGHTMSLIGNVAVNLSQRNRRELKDWPDDERRVHAVAGIGNPSRFFNALREHGFDVIEHPFADHHSFVASDLQFGDSLPVIMTEKDAVKCASFSEDNWWMLPVDANIADEFFEVLDMLLASRAPIR
ncbi:Tetraacyldisaccharide 4'-kinase [Zhongshania aliphaticivorans]|uniref:Tetraacyldisaccharide 4'-kinase n=2 Tax=Zhongshania aliphaticivorans TaxID=1470434 RepID=A0A5S9NEI8_9GAMM|nr:tetraacyldisaccharide 4'-kinase [Zhongshania aliphaticivorans]CAA0088415.1 Tetraacyldisaccharide 4'-kinase [Zhongshania aliphaticivorans]CAA0120507.1 Tetraacyldisaccharide 4'-kinase [Zhongshania aliphaticivorans]